MNNRICCLCGKKMEYEFGNNPFPLKKTGTCCNNCNYTKVIPERIKISKDTKKNK